MAQVAQVAVYSQTNTKHINTVWEEGTIFLILHVLVHHVTSRFERVKSPSARQ
jgi:hypothetical protein